MGALRGQIVDCSQLGGQSGNLSPFTVLIDSWEAVFIVQENGAVGSSQNSNWIMAIRGGGSCNVALLTGAQGFDSVVFKLGGFTHQLGNGRDASPGNLNITIDFTPIDPARDGMSMVIIKTYFDKTLVDPDFPG